MAETWVHFFIMVLQDTNTILIDMVEIAVVIKTMTTLNLSIITTDKELTCITVDHHAMRIKNSEVADSLLKTIPDMKWNIEEVVKEVHHQ